MNNEPTQERLESEIRRAAAEISEQARMLLLDASSGNAARMAPARFEAILQYANRAMELVDAFPLEQVPLSTRGDAASTHFGTDQERWRTA